MESVIGVRVGAWEELPQVDNFPAAVEVSSSSVRRTDEGCSPHCAGKDKSPT